ncbi:MAG: SIS domain-containing protein [Pseudonocardia sp.]|nr:SIS domain-containing protein [Pseudonocardia sp.]
MAAGEVAGRWTAGALALLEKLLGRERQHLILAAIWCADAIHAGGMAHLFGTGHSRMAAEEMFPRYGSYPGFNPLVELSMTFHTQVVGANGQRQAMFIERMPGLAETILANFEFRPTDVLLVFSVSGTTAVPIEMAIGARERGIKVVAATSVAHSNASPATHPRGRLFDHADLVIDLGTPVGDSLVTVEGMDTPVGPGSTVAAVSVVNEIKVITAQLLLERGVVPPVITSPALVGAERSAELFDAAYREHARRASAALAGAERGRSEAAAS